MSQNENDKPIHRMSLPKKWMEHCSNMSESGMGYQKVNCKVNKAGREAIVPAIVLNGQFIESVEPIWAENILDITLVG